MQQYLFDIWYGASRLEVTIWSISKTEAREALWELYASATQIEPRL